MRGSSKNDAKNVFARRIRKFFFSLSLLLSLSFPLSCSLSLCRTCCKCQSSKTRKFEGHVRKGNDAHTHTLTHKCRPHIERNSTLLVDMRTLQALALSRSLVLFKAALYQQSSLCLSLVGICFCFIDAAASLASLLLLLLLLLLS